jgi:hypothetical protein
MMDNDIPRWAPRPIWRVFVGLILAGLLALLAPAASPAAISTFGSPLSVPATLNTAENLGYYGTYTPVPPAPDAPNGLFHTFHWGADTALWNTSPLHGNPKVPATGQAVRIALEGCAKAAPAGPRPNTQIHLQDISPLRDGGAKVKISSQGFDIPICGERGASGRTVTTYEPVNLCVAQGDYVAFNDEGGYVPYIYRAGVQYQVMGLVTGSRTSSFIRDNGVGNGAVMSARDVGPNDGFMSNPNEELMMRVTLGTRSDATHICAGGTRGLPPPLAPVRVSPQTDGVNHSGIVAVAMYCRVSPSCNGVATLTMPGSSTIHGRSGFFLQPNKTSHLKIRVSSRLLTLIRRHHGVSATLTAVMRGKTITQRIGVKTF